MKVLAPACLRFCLFALALGMLLTAAPAASAADGGYSTHPWAGCPGGYNSGSWDDAGRLYIPCGSPSIIGVYDTNARLVESITTNRFVSDVAPTRDGRYLYLAGPDGPSRLVRNAQGTWVVDAWTPASYTLWNRQFNVGGHFVATDVAGNVYYADGAWAPNSTHTVVKYAPDGRLITRFGEWARTWELGKFYWALGGLAVSPDGATVYTVELGNNRVQEWARTGNGGYGVQRSIGGTVLNNADRAGYCDYDGWLGKFAAPYDLGMDRAGNLYVINTTCKQVLKFTPGFAALVANLDVRIGDGDYPRPHGFAVGADGTIYVGENQRMHRPAHGALPVDGKPPVQPTPPAPAPAAPAPAATNPAPAPVVSTPAPVPVKTTPTTIAKDTIAPRLVVSRRPYGVVRRGVRMMYLRVWCSEACRADILVMHRGRLSGRRVLWLPARRSVLVAVRVGATTGTRLVTIDVDASDRRGNTSNVVRRATAPR